MNQEAREYIDAAPNRKERNRRKALVHGIIDHVPGRAGWTRQRGKRKWRFTKNRLGGRVKLPRSIARTLDDFEAAVRVYAMNPDDTHEDLEMQMKAKREILIRNIKAELVRLGG